MTNRIGQATPGPWRVQGGEIVSASDPICSMPALYRSTKEAKAQLAADAHLIAAAPELYEALELVEPALVAAVAEADAGGPNEGLDLLCGFVKRALAKARGEQPAREQVL
jgi:hypothetical protein